MASSHVNATMMPHVETRSGVGRAAERFSGRVVALIAGLALMFGGIGLGVTVVLLPVGVVVGLLGLYLFLYGLAAPAFRRRDEA